ncbi:MAG: DinB family protein [Thermoplasmata archaeon]
MRTELDVIRELYKYNSRVRKKYLTAIWRLPQKKRYKARGASYPSMVDIFLHVLDAYRWWFRTVYGSDPDWTDYPLGQRLTRAQAVREERATDRLVLGIVAKLRPGDLARTFKIPGAGSRGRRISLRVLLLHMAEEELQHRGEMNALLWQEDVDPPISGFGE